MNTEISLEEAERRMDVMDVLHHERGCLVDEAKASRRAARPAEALEAWGRVNAVTARIKEASDVFARYDALMASVSTERLVRL